MLVFVCGPYSASTAAERQQNLEILNRIAAEVFLSGHAPIVGLNVALPLAKSLNRDSDYGLVMEICLMLLRSCDAVLVYASSPGADMEVAEGRRMQIPIFQSIEELKSIHEG